MTIMPFISVIIPTYNSEKYLDRAINSVINQNYLSCEIVFVDGVSQDNTLAIIEKFKSQKKISMQLVSEKDEGIYDAINKGIDRCRGDLIVVLGSDDWIEENAFFNVAKEYKKGRIIIYGAVRCLIDAKEYKIEFVNHHFLKEQTINHQVCYISKETYQEIGNYDCKLRSNADHDFLLRCMEKEEIEFLPVYKILADFSLGGMSSSLQEQIDANIIAYKYGMKSKRNFIIRSLICKMKSLLKMK